MLKINSGARYQPPLNLNFHLNILIYQLANIQSGAASPADVK